MHGRIVVVEVAAFEVLVDIVVGVVGIVEGEVKQAFVDRCWAEHSFRWRRLVVAVVEVVGIVVEVVGIVVEVVGIVVGVVDIVEVEFELVVELVVVEP